jgi:60 kDa SS-A/Ro ribonucleoprotein
MLDTYKSISTRRTPQDQPAGGATVKNAAGGYVFGIDDVTRLRRFLILGADSSTYYTSVPKLTRDNAAVVIRMAENDPTTLVDTIVEISVAGRAPRQNSAIFALAVAASAPDERARAYALSKLNAVCRTGTHLFLFSTYIEQFRGWGPALKRAVGNWYTSKDVDKLAYQLLKYRQRETWTHRDLLRLSRPNPGSPERDALFEYLMIIAKGDHVPSPHALDKYGDAARSPHAGKAPNFDELPILVSAFEEIQATGYQPTSTSSELIETHKRIHREVSPRLAVGLIEVADLSWEMLPDELLTKPEVWEALIHKGLPQTALMRQLPRLTNLGLTTGDTGKVIADQLMDVQKLKLGRVHPINVLIAQKTYASGSSARGSSTWTPTRRITDALDAAFYASYGAVEPSGKRVLLACDVSGSMDSPASGLPITCREAVAALSLVALNTETDAEIIGFTSGKVDQTRSSFNSIPYWPTVGRFESANSVVRLDITPRRRLDDVCQYMSRLPFGRTDCSLPMTWAMQNKLDFDAITILTDNETWYGNIHPHQALKLYRESVGHDVKLAVVAMTATGTSIADPNDPSSMDIAGFDSNVPQVLSEFAAGRI